MFQSSLIDAQLLNYTEFVGKKSSFRLLNRGSAKALDKVVELDASFGSAAKGTGLEALEFALSICESVDMHGFTVNPGYKEWTRYSSESRQEIHPPETHLNSGGFGGGGSSGGGGALTSTETVGSKRQRRPSVRLGEIGGGDQLYESQHHRRTASNSWKQQQQQQILGFKEVN